MTDQGKQFCNKLADELYKKIGVQHLRTSAYHPQTNPSAESFNHELNKIMCTLLDDPDDKEWELFCPLCSSHITPPSAARQTPPRFSLRIYSTPICRTSREVGERASFEEINLAADRFDRMKKISRLTQQGITAAAARDVLYYNRDHSHLDFRVGDWVFVKHERATFQKMKNKKFVKTWKKAVVQRIRGTTTCHIGNLGVSYVYFGDHITTDYNMYYATYCIFFSLFLTRAR